MQNTIKPENLKKKTVMFYENIHIVDENIFWIWLKNLSIEIMKLQRLYSLRYLALQQSTLKDEYSCNSLTRKCELISSAKSKHEFIIASKLSNPTSPFS